MLQWYVCTCICVCLYICMYMCSICMSCIHVCVGVCRRHLVLIFFTHTGILSLTGFLACLCFPATQSIPDSMSCLRTQDDRFLTALDPEDHHAFVFATQQPHSSLTFLAWRLILLKENCQPEDFFSSEKLLFPSLTLTKWYFTDLSSAFLIASIHSVSVFPKLIID